MMSKLTAQGSSKNRPKFIKEKGETKLEIIIIKIDIKVGIDQPVAIGKCHIEIELSMDKIIEEDHSMIKFTEDT